MKFLKVLLYLTIFVFEGWSKEIPSVYDVELHDFNIEQLIMKEKEGAYAKNIRVYIQSHTDAQISCGSKSKEESVHWTFENEAKIENVVSWNSKILISKGKSTIQFTFASFWMTGLYYCSPNGNETGFERYEYTVKVYTLAKIGVTFKFTFLTTDCYKEPVKSEALKVIKEFFCPELKETESKKSVKAKRGLRDDHKKGYNSAYKKNSNYMAKKFSRRIKRHLIKQLIKYRNNSSDYKRRSISKISKIQKILHKRGADTTKKLSIKFFDVFPYDAALKQYQPDKNNSITEEFGELSEQEYFSNVSTNEELSIDCNYDFKKHCNGFDTEPWLSIRNGRRVVMSQMTATIYSTVPRSEGCDMKCGIQMKIDQLNNMLKEVDLQVIRKTLSDKYKTLDGRFMKDLVIKNGKVIRLPKKVSYTGHFLCPPGQVVFQRQTCIPCDKGTFSNGYNEKDTCDRCPKNTYQAYMGATKCESCGINMITDEIAATSNTFCIDRQAKFQNKLINDSVARYMINIRTYYTREVILFASSALSIVICIMMWFCLLFQDASRFSSEWISSMKYRWFMCERKFKEKGLFYDSDESISSP